MTGYDLVVIPNENWYVKSITLDRASDLLDLLRRVNPCICCSRPQSLPRHSAPFRFLSRLSLRKPGISGPAWRRFRARLHRAPLSPSRGSSPDNLTQNNAQTGAVLRLFIAEVWAADRSTCCAVLAESAGSLQRRILRLRLLRLTEWKFELRLASIESNRSFNLPCFCRWRSISKSC